MMWVLRATFRKQIRQLTVHLCNISLGVLAVMKECGLLPAVVVELELAADDVLLQLNALQCLTDLAAGKAHCTRVRRPTVTLP